VKSRKLIENKNPKTCKTCHITKAYTEFEKNQASIKGQVIRRPDCRKCRSKKKKIEPKERRIYEYNHPGPKIGEKFTCPICQKNIIRKFSNDVNLDHSHIDGKIRGWLCSKCNTSVGALGDDIENLERAIKWLKGELPVWNSDDEMMF